MSVCAVVCGAELQIRTTDGQTVQGEYLGTDNKLVKIRTKFGVVQIPSKDIVTLTAVAPPAAAAPAAGAVPGETPQAPVVATGVPLGIGDVTAPAFPEVKRVDFISLEANRAALFPPGELSKGERQELSRAIRNFSDSTELSRKKIIRSLQGFGRAAYPFIAAAYTLPAELGDRIELLEALAVPGSPFTASTFAESHAASRASYAGTASLPPPPPPDYPSRRDRIPSRSADLKGAARDVLDIENYASIAGGPFNALMLVEIYVERYSAEKVDPLVSDVARDRVRLAATAADAGKTRTSWSGADRAMLADQLLPLLFKPSEELQLLPRDMLKKILPTGYPKWDAGPTEWSEWWSKKRADVEKSKK